MYVFNDEKAMKWLQKKCERIILCLKKQNPEKMETEIIMDALAILCEYIPNDMFEQLCTQTYKFNAMIFFFFIFLFCVFVYIFLHVFRWNFGFLVLFAETTHVYFSHTKCSFKMQ